VEALKAVHVHSDRIRGLCVDRFGTLGLVVSHDGGATLWELSGARTHVLHTWTHGAPVLQGVITDKFAFTGAENGTVCAWDLIVCVPFCLRVLT